MENNYVRVDVMTVDPCGRCITHGYREEAMGHCANDCTYDRGAFCTWCGDNTHYFQECPMDASVQKLKGQTILGLIQTLATRVSRDTVPRIFWDDLAIRSHENRVRDDVEKQRQLQEQKEAHEAAEAAAEAQKKRTQPNYRK